MRNIARIAGLCVVVVVVAGTVASADTTREDAAPFAYDETAARGNLGDAPSGWGNTSWQGPDTGKLNYHVWYTEISGGAAVDLDDLFGAGHGLTVADVESISYHTKKGASVPADRDFWLSVYTQEENDGEDAGSWYDSRLHARPDVGPSYSDSFTYDAWNLWSTDDAASSTNQLMFYDSGRGWNGYYETLENLGADEVTWGNGESHDYRNELLKSITLQTDSGWDGFDGNLDGLTITLADGDIGEVNMVPEPVTMSLLGFGGLAVLRRRRR